MGFGFGLGFRLLFKNRKFFFFGKPDLYIAGDTNPKFSGGNNIASSNGYSLKKNADAAAAVGVGVVVGIAVVVGGATTTANVGTVVVVVAADVVCCCCCLLWLCFVCFWVCFVLV